MSAILATSCAGPNFITKMVRQGQNEGYELSGDVESATMVAEKVLQDRGFMISTVKIVKGPGVNAGRRVEGFRSLRERPDGGRKVFGGPERQADYAELVQLDISPKWHVTYDTAVPGSIIMVLGGSRCIEDMKGALINCSKADDAIGLTSIRNEFINRLATVVSSQAPAGDGEDDDGGGKGYLDAMELYGKGDYKGALALAGKVTTERPGAWRSWQLMGSCQYALGDRAAALSSYKYSLAINPNNPGLQSWVAKLEGK